MVSSPSAKTYDPQLAAIEPEKKSSVKTTGSCSWLLELHNAFGIKFLIIIFFGQQCLRGAGDSLATAIFPWMLSEYHVSATRLTLYSAIVWLPYSCKVCIGLTSDFLPFLGYRKMPYMVLTTLMACSGFALLSFEKDISIPELLVVLLFLFGRLQSATCDTLIEAQMAIRIRDNPAQGKNLVAFYSVGVTVLATLAGALYGPLSENGVAGPDTALKVLAALCSIVLIPAFLNFHGEKMVNADEVAELRSQLAQMKEVIFLGVLVSSGSVLCAVLGTMVTNPLSLLLVTVSVIVIDVAALNIVLRPDLAGLMTYALFGSAAHLDTGAAAFYFFTDNRVAYPEGPHFSPMFYNTVMPLVSSGALIIGICLYTRYGALLRYRTAFVIINITMCAVALPDLIIFSRKNLQWGIPDEIFMLSISALSPFAGTWYYIVIVTIISKCCPKKIEATVFSLMASFANFGTIVSKVTTSYLLDVFSVNPSGMPHESAQFDNMCYVLICTACFSLVLVPPVFWLVPDAGPEDKMTTADASITEGSIYSWWTAMDDAAACSDSKC